MEEEKRKIENTREELEKKDRLWREEAEQRKQLTLDIDRLRGEIGKKTQQLEDRIQELSSSILTRVEENNQLTDKLRNAMEEKKKQDLTIATLGDLVKVVKISKHYFTTNPDDID